MGQEGWPRCAIHAAAAAMAAQQQACIVACQALHSHGAQMKAKHQLRMTPNIADLQTLSGMVTCQHDAATTLRVAARTLRPLTAPEYPSCRVYRPPR